jgi:hypothetical protein
MRGETTRVAFGFDQGSPPLAPGTPSPDWSARIQKLERDVAALQRKFDEMQTKLRRFRGED